MAPKVLNPRCQQGRKIIIKAWFLEKSEQDSTSIPNLNKMHKNYQGYSGKCNHMKMYFTHLFPQKPLLIPLNIPVLRKFTKKKIRNSFI